MCRKDDRLKEVVAKERMAGSMKMSSLYLECKKTKSSVKMKRENAQYSSSDSRSVFQREPSGWRGFTWQRWKKEKDGMSMQLNDRNQMAKIWNLVSLAGLLICVALAFWAYKNGILDSVDTLQAFIESCRIWRNGNFCTDSDCPGSHSDSSRRNQLPGEE